MGMAGKDSFTPGKDKIIKQRKADKEDDDGWNEEQQKSLEAALKKYPKTLPAKERWTSIAGEVEGKTPKECLA